MRSHTVHRALLVGCLLVAAALIGVLPSAVRREARLAAEARALDLLSTEGLADATGLWTRSIQAQGAPAAYAAVKGIYADAGIRTQHIAAHTFGEALYGTLGLAGFPVCDGAYAYGCFHGLFGKAIEEQGLVAARALYATCFAGPSADMSILCTHGIGHGLVAYFGYDRPALAESLAVCDSLDGHLERNGCLRGVFMEYNLRGVHFVDENAERPFNAAAPMEPCDELSGNQARVCVFSLPQWWRHHLMASGLADLDAYSTIGARCATLADAMRQACFEGVGYIVPSSSGFSTEGTIARCALASADRGDEEDCRVLAANTMSAWGRPELSGAICDGLMAEAKARCMDQRMLLRDEAKDETRR